MKRCTAKINLRNTCFEHVEYRYRYMDFPKIEVLLRTPHKISIRLLTGENKGEVKVVCHSSIEALCRHS